MLITIIMIGMGAMIVHQSWRLAKMQYKIEVMGTFLTKLRKEFPVEYGSVERKMLEDFDAAVKKASEKKQSNQGGVK